MEPARPSDPEPPSPSLSAQADDGPDDGPPPALRATGLGLGDVLQRVDLAVSPGQCLGVVGPNGAGKSTLLGLLAGVLRSSRGLVQRAQLAYLPEGAPLDAGLTVGAWLQLARSLPGWDEGLGRQAEQTFPLPSRRDASRLSQGQRVQLGLVLALGRRRPLYVLDDPFLGLDPMAKARVEELLAARSERAAVVLAAQDAEAVERLCSDVLLLRGGRAVRQDSVEGWRARYRRLQVHGEVPVEASVLRRRPGLRGEQIWTNDPDFESRCHACGVQTTPLPLRFDEVLELAITEESP